MPPLIGPRSDPRLEPAYIALDLETTGLNADRDAIIEVAAVRFAGAEVLGTFETFVRPTVDLPLRVQQITGLTPDDLVGAPEIDAVIEGLAAFVGDTPLVGHSVDHDRRYLQRYGASLTQPALDTFELASILIPEATRYGLGELVDLLGLDVPADSRHRALADAHAHRLLFLVLCERARALPADVIDTINRLSERVDWPLARVFGAAMTSPRNGLPPRAPAAPKLDADGGPGTLPVAERAPGRADRALPAPALALDRLAARWDAFERRQAQYTLLEHLTGAFERGGQYLVEAGAGVGKRLAYLIPAAARARADGRPVVVATHSLDLQRRMVEEDLPRVATALGEAVHGCVLKDRSRYLCPARLAGLAQRVDWDVETVRAAAKILVWARVTATGDRDELMLFGGEARAWDRVGAADETCAAGRCRTGTGGTCWSELARARAEAADVVVVDHACLLRDTVPEHPFIPAHTHLVIDEAHHLEAASTEAFGQRIAGAEAREVLGDLAEVEGLTGRVRRGLEATGASSDVRPMAPAAMASRLDGVRGRAEEAVAHFEAFLHALAVFMTAHAGRAESTLRLTSGARRQPDWAAVEATWDPLRDDLAALVADLDTLWAELAEPAGDPPAPAATAWLADLAAARRAVGAMADGIEAMLGRPSAAEVSWVARAHAGQLVLHRAPVFVDDALGRRVFAGKAALVLISATLSAGDDFDYARAQLGLPDAEAVIVPSPFDYTAAGLLYLPTDLPSHEQPQYRKLLNQTLVALARALGGRMLVLYTSFSGLKESYHAIRKTLGDAGIVVLGQGLDGSRHNLLAGLREAGLPTVLLGTSAYWEGVDIPGPALSGLVITRLPFGLPTDPVFAARSEVFDDPFRDFAVPQAVLRLRQAVEQLIRTPADRGVVAILDRRIHSQSYGWMFLDALPSFRRVEGTLAALPAAAERWCGADPSPVAAAPARDIPPLGGEPP